MPVRDIQFWRSWGRWLVLFIAAVLVITLLVRPAAEPHWLGDWSAEAAIDGTTLITRVTDDFTAPAGDYWRLIDVFLVVGDDQRFLTESRDHRPAGTVTIQDRFPMEDVLLAESAGTWRIRIRRRIARDADGDDVVSLHQWVIPIKDMIAPAAMPTQ